MRLCNMGKACQVWPIPCIYLPGNYTARGKFWWEKEH